MTKESLIHQARQQTLDLIRRAERHFGLRISQSGIHFDLKGKAAGMVVFPPGEKPYIRFNPGLLMLNQAHFLAQTLPHEVAHLVARRLYGANIRPHGDEWKQVMAFYGADPIRCHNYELGNSCTRKIRRFTYRCGCRQHQLTAIRHNRILKGQAYFCKFCGESLRALK